MPRASVVFGMRDDDMSTTCPGCELVQTLAEARVDDSDRRTTTYDCVACSTTILIVQTRSRIPWDGFGHRIRSWVIRNPRDLLLRPDPTGRPSVIRGARTG